MIIAIMILSVFPDLGQRTRDTLVREGKLPHELLFLTELDPYPVRTVEDYGDVITGMSVTGEAQWEGEHEYRDVFTFSVGGDAKALLKRLRHALRGESGWRTTSYKGEPARASFFHKTIGFEVYFVEQRFGNSSLTTVTVKDDRGS